MKRRPYKYSDKLTLTRQTLRLLNEVEIHNAAGGSSVDQSCLEHATAHLPISYYSCGATALPQETDV